MVLKDYRIDVKVTPRINLYCIGDLHIGSPVFLQNAFDKLADIVRKDKYAYFIQVGDLTEDDRPTTRVLRRAMFNDREEAMVQEDLQHISWMDSFVVPKLLKVIKPARCFGMLEGDHYRVYANGLSSVQYVCAKTKIPYLGQGQALIRLHMLDGKKENILRIHTHHGKGGGVTEAGDLRELQAVQHQWRNVSVFLRGHSHKPKFVPFTWWYDTIDKVLTQEGYLINAGAFRGGMLMGKVDYAESAVYSPTSTCCPILHIDTSPITLSASLTPAL